LRPLRLLRVMPSAAPVPLHCPLFRPHHSSFYSPPARHAARRMTRSL